MPISYDWARFDQSIADQRATLNTLKQQCDELMDNTARWNEQAIMIARAQSGKRIEDLTSSRLGPETQHRADQLRSLKRDCRKLRTRLAAAYSRLAFQRLSSLARRAGAVLVRARTSLINLLRGESDER